MIKVGTSFMGMNSPIFYERLLNRLDFKEKIEVDDVDFSKSYDYILFDGGSDVSPDLYGQMNIASHVNKLRDEHELRIFNHYKDTNTKFVGICRGHQLLNVFYGGTLFQNLSDLFLQHASYHTISINYNSNSILKEILPSITEVNSLHHQGVNKLANNLLPIAFETRTGIIEIYDEKDDKARCVQFHPEFYNSFPFTKEILRWLFRFYS
jgi:putative glutamine amidotransferase